MKHAHRLAAFLFAAVGSGEAADLHYSVGVQDFDVPDAHSHTYGLNGSISLDERSESGRHVFAALDLFVDWDQDHLDPDHIPIWWEGQAGADDELWRSGNARIGWTANVDTRANTVSSIERRITALPALAGGYDGKVVQGSVQAGAGWFFLEIDDDVPKTRGYDRDDFRNSELGYSAAADLSLRLGESWTLFGRAQQWWDGHEWLQTQYLVSLKMDTGQHHSRSSAFVLSADFNEYNLDVYARPDVAQPILPWNDDVVIRLSFDTAW